MVDIPESLPGVPDVIVLAVGIYPFHLPLYLVRMPLPLDQIPYLCLFIRWFCCIMYPFLFCCIRCPSIKWDFQQCYIWFPSLITFYFDTLLCFIVCFSTC